MRAFTSAKVKVLEVGCARECSTIASGIVHYIIQFECNAFILLHDTESSFTEEL